MSKFIYEDNKTFFHRLDPRTKLLVTFAHYLVVTLWVYQLYFMGVVLLEVLILAYLSKSMQTVKKVAFVAVIIFITGEIMWNISSRGATPLWGPITLEPVLMGLGAALRSGIGIFISMVLLATTRNEELTQGLLKIKVPFRVSFAFSSALRMAPTLIGTTMTVVDAQKSRGLNMEKGGFIERFKKFVPLVVPAFLLTMRSTDQMAMAIESRGFGYQEKRSSLIQLSLKKADYIWIVLSVLLMVFAIVTSILKWGVVFTL